MNTLITACLKEKNIQPLIEFPRHLMSEWDTAIVDYIIDYNNTYKESPSVSRVSREFDTFVSINSPDPLMDIRDQEFQQLVSQKAINILESELVKLRSGEKFDVGSHMGSLSSLAESTAYVDRYTTFDRSAYFRGKAIKIGLPIIDHVTKGVGQGEIMLVVGRLGVGKSTLLQFFTDRWLRSGIDKILFVSKEMPSVDVFARMDAIVGKFNPLDLRDEEKAEGLMGQLGVVQRIVQATNTEIYMPKLNVWSVEQIHSLAKTLNVGAVVVDGVYHLTTEKTSKYAAGWENLTQVSRALKAAAMDLNVPMLNTSQLKRGAGSAAKFDSEDIAFADALGQDADFIIGIRPLGIPGKKRAELELMKNRYGPNVTNLVELRYDSMTMRDVSATGDVDEDA